MSFLASVLRAVYKLSGAKKSFALPEDRLLQEIEKQNRSRGFLTPFWQMLVILSVMNLIDWFLIDDYWVGHTKAWTIPGTEDLKPYINAAAKRRKWLFGTVGMVVISAVLAGLMLLFLH